MLRYSPNNNTRASNAAGDADSQRESVPTNKCPDTTCGGDIVLKTSRVGTKFFSCSKWARDNRGCNLRFNRLLAGDVRCDLCNATVVELPIVGHVKGEDSEDEDVEEGETSYPPSTALIKSSTRLGLSLQFFHLIFTCIRPRSAYHTSPTSFLPQTSVSCLPLSDKSTTPSYMSSSRRAHVQERRKST